MLPVQGVTLVEVLVTIVVVGVLAAVAAPNVTKLGSKPLPDTANQMAGVFRSARAKAIASTSPIRVRPKDRQAVLSGTSTGGLNTQFEVWRTTKTTANCHSDASAEGWVLDGTLSSEYLTLAKGIILQSTEVDGAILSVPTGWEVCFNTRGMASTTSTRTSDFVGNNVKLTFQQTSDNKTKSIEIFPAGGIQVYDN
jgi:type IV fimbrial biogenesis protein FimT